MKNFEIKKEVWIWFIILLPIAYLMYRWNAMPEVVPTHFGMDGTPNGWSHKEMLLYLVPGLTIGLYILLTIVPTIDPKRKLDGMGKKYFLFKLFMMLFMSVLCLMMMQAAFTQSMGSPNVVFVLVGALFAFLGNYMQSVKPNYFIGIRTPWTLENETVWRKTHRVGGRLFFIAGLIIMGLPFVVHTRFHYIFLGIVAVVVIVPMIYSYVVYREEKIASK